MTGTRFAFQEEKSKHREQVFFYGDCVLCGMCDREIRLGYKLETDAYLKSIGWYPKPKYDKSSKKKHF